MKLRYFLLALLFFIITFLAVTYWLLLQTLSSKSLVNLASMELTKLVQEPIQIHGSLHVAVLPQLGIHINDVEIGTPSSPHYIQVDDLFLKVSLLPLLQGRVVFNQIKIDGFTSSLQLSALSSNTTTSSPPFQYLAVDRIILKHGTLELIAPEYTIMLTNFRLNAEQLNIQNYAFPFDLSAHVEWTDLKRHHVFMKFRLKGNTSLPPSFLTNPYEAFINLPLSAQLTAKELHFPLLVIDSLEANLQTKSKTILLNPLTLNLYHGRADGSLNFDTQTKKLFLNQAAKGLHGETFFKALFPNSNNPITGDLDLSMHAYLNLTHPHPIDNFTGNGTLTLRNGQIKNFNLARLISTIQRKLHHLLSHLPPPEHQSQISEMPSIISPMLLEGNTPFRLLSFQYHLERNRIQLYSLLFQSQWLELKGEGMFNFESHHLDTHTLIYFDTGDDELNKIQRLLGGGIPLHIYGPLTQPEILPSSRLLPLLQSMWIKRNIEHPSNVLQQEINRIFDFTIPDE